MGSNGRGEYNNARVMRTGNGADFSEGTPRSYNNRRSDSDAAQRGPPTHDENGEELQTQNISIPSDMVVSLVGLAAKSVRSERHQEHESQSPKVSFSSFELTAQIWW
jgi:heterogeneous nuclear rnp K-like protein 2